LLWTERGPLYMARFFHDDDKQAALFAHIDGLVTSQLARGARLTSARFPPTPSSRRHGWHWPCDKIAQPSRGRCLDHR
jgi:hypothetical protein